MSSRGVRLTFRDNGDHNGAPAVVWARGLNTYVRATRVNKGGDPQARIEIYDIAGNTWLEFDNYSKKRGDYDYNAGDAAVAAGDDGSCMFIISAGDGTGKGEIRDGWAYYPSTATGWPAADGRTPVQFTSATEDAFARQQIAAIAQSAANAAVKAEQAHGRANDMIKLVKDEVKKAVGKVTGGLDVRSVLQAVSDDLASDTGIIRHALWPRVQKMLADGMYLMLKDASSPLINVIRQGGQVIT